MPVPSLPSSLSQASLLNTVFPLEPTTTVTNSQHYTHNSIPSQNAYWF